MLSIITIIQAQEPSALVEYESTTQGVLTTRMTEAQRAAIRNPATGLLVYQIDGDSGFWYYDGGIWRLLITLDQSSSSPSSLESEILTGADEFGTFRRENFVYGINTNEIIDCTVHDELVACIDIDSLYIINVDDDPNNDFTFTQYTLEPDTSIFIGPGFRKVERIFSSFLCNDCRDYIAVIGNGRIDTYDRDEDWELIGSIVPNDYSGNSFGTSAMYSDFRLAVGAPVEDEAFIFEFGSTISQYKFSGNSGDRFGQSIIIMDESSFSSTELLLVGAPDADVDGHTAAGQVHLFEICCDEDWSQADEGIITEPSAYQGLFPSFDNFGAYLTFNESPPFGSDSRNGAIIGSTGGSNLTNGLPTGAAYWIQPDFSLFGNLHHDERFIRFTPQHSGGFFQLGSSDNSDRIEILVSNSSGVYFFDRSEISLQDDETAVASLSLRLLSDHPQINPLSLDNFGKYMGSNNNFILIASDRYLHIYDK